MLCMLLIIFCYVLCSVYYVIAILFQSTRGGRGRGRGRGRGIYSQPGYNFDLSPPKDTSTVARGRSPGGYRSGYGGRGSRWGSRYSIPSVSETAIKNQSAAQSQICREGSPEIEVVSEKKATNPVRKYISFHA